VFYGVSNAIAYCTNTSRGLSTTAELRLRYAYAVVLGRSIVCNTYVETYKSLEVVGQVHVFVGYLGFCPC